MQPPASCIRNTLAGVEILTDNLRIPVVCCVCKLHWERVYGQRQRVGNGVRHFRKPADSQDSVACAANGRHRVDVGHEVCDWQVEAVVPVLAVADEVVRHCVCVCVCVGVQHDGTRVSWQDVFKTSQVLYNVYRTYVNKSMHIAWQ
jgi:hypothetical protein